MSSRLGEFANIYELLDESDASGVETGKKAKEVVEQKKAAAAAALAPPVQKPTPGQTGKPTGERRTGDRNFNGENRGPRTDRPPRGPRPEGDRPPRAPRADGDRPPRAPRAEGDRPPRAPRAEGDRPPRTEGDRPRRPRNDSPKEGGENSFAESGQPTAEGAPRPYIPRGERGGPRPDRGYERRHTGDQDQRPGKREFDRRSGTGRGKEVHKGGAGKGNWGSVDAEAAAGEGSDDVVAEKDAKKEGEEAAADAAAPVEATTEAEVAPVDDEPAVRTLEAYLQEKKSKTVAALPPPRQAGEGEDTSAWAGYAVAKKEEESLFAVEKTSKDKKNKEAKDSKEKKVAADQVLRFQQDRKDREERGGSRGGRGGRGGQQGGQKRGNASSAPNFGDASAFPGLSTKA